jgi:hypothetical protein
VRQYETVAVWPARIPALHPVNCVFRSTERKAEYGANMAVAISYLSVFETVLDDVRKESYFYSPVKRSN